MRLIGLMLARNESWCIGLSLRVALEWCDAVIVFNHASTDQTTAIVHEVMGEVGTERVLYTREEDPLFDEMAYRQWTLNAARKLGATHIAICDADEILTGNLAHGMTGANNVRVCMNSMMRGRILQLPLYNLRRGLMRYHSNGIWGKRWGSLAFNDDPRLSWYGDTFHSREPKGIQLQPYKPIPQGQGGILHLWGASERRLRSKSAHYKLTERLRWPNKPVAEIERMYSWAIKGEPGHPSFGTPDTWTYATVPDSRLPVRSVDGHEFPWWAPYAKWMQYLDIYAEPWQEKACIDIIKEHGPAMFKGLDLFNVI